MTAVRLADPPTQTASHRQIPSPPDRIERLLMYRLLQLSDIHFGAEHAFAQDGRPLTARNLRRAVGVALADNDIPGDFDALILSGDVFSRQDPLERTEARLQLALLAEDVGAREVIMVPGNHDVDWDAEPSDRLYHYRQLALDLSALGTPEQFPAIHIIGADGEKPLVLTALNSCMLESKAQRGLGLIGDEQLDALAARLRAAQVTPETHALVAIMHHHLLPVATRPVLPATVDPGDSTRLVVSVTVDATTVLGRLAELGFSLVLHGHQHIPVIMQFAITRWSHGPLHVAAAGSVGLMKGEVRRQFFVWEIEDGIARAISLRHREDEPGRFEPDPDNSTTLRLR